MRIATPMFPPRLHAIDGGSELGAEQVEIADCDFGPAMRYLAASPADTSAIVSSFMMPALTKSRSNRFSASRRCRAAI
jgi:hypothetical protein